MQYLEFLTTNGVEVSQINPGSDEIALAAKYAIYALNLLKAEGYAIYGGDILTIGKNHKLQYAFTDWGYNYQYLNWYCSKEPFEKIEDFVERSNGVAKSAISKAISISKDLKKECLVVLVVSKDVVGQIKC